MTTCMSSASEPPLEAEGMSKLFLDVIPRLCRILDIADTPQAQEEFRLAREAFRDSDSSWTQTMIEMIDRPTETEDFTPYTGGGDQGGNETGDATKKTVPSVRNGRPSKILIFSRQPGVLNAIASVLERLIGGLRNSTYDEWDALAVAERSRGFLRIDGSVPTKLRPDLMKIFEENDSPRVFLLTTQTAGVGLNLQSSNVVFMLDPWWNPASERQAIDRMWRLGSPHEDVFVYRWLVRGTLDQTAFERKQEKQELFDQVFGPVEQQSHAMSLSAAQSRELNERLVAANVHVLPERNKGLYQHQSVGVHWMESMEKSDMHGGILADDMGVGKTVQTICTVALDAAAQDAEADGRPTLIVGPIAALNSWVKDLATWVPGAVCHVYHADPLGEVFSQPDAAEAKHHKSLAYSHGKWRSSDLNRLQREAQDEQRPLFVLVNIDHFARDDWFRDAHGGDSAIGAMRWRRVVVDESQRLNNKKNGFDKLCSLDAAFRWSLSGTPLENKIADLEAHRTFLRVPPATDMQTLVLRRTKMGISQNVVTNGADATARLPRAFERYLEMELSAREAEAYESTKSVFSWKTATKRVPLGQGAPSGPRHRGTEGTAGSSSGTGDAVEGSLPLLLPKPE